MTRGFTLIELIVVVVILAIVGAIAIPARSGATRDYRIQLMESRVSADLMFLQRASWHASTQCRLSFSPAKDAYLIHKSAIHPADTPVFLGDSPYRLTIDTVDFGDGVDGVTFADGAPVTGAVGKVLFTISAQPFAARIDAAAATMESAPR